MSLNLDPSTWRITYPKHHPATPGGDFKVKLMEGYPRLSIGKDDAMVEEQIIIEAEEVGRFISDAFPLVSVKSDKLQVPKTRTRFFPGLGVFLASTIEAQPFIEGLPADPFLLDEGAPEKTYTRFYVLTIKYDAPPGLNDQEGSPGDEIDPLTFLERSCVATGEYLHSYGPSRMRYKAELGAVGAAADAALEVETTNQAGLPVIITVPEIEWTLKWPIIPADLMSDVIVPNMDARQGTVNFAVMPIFFNAQPETVLFVGYNINQAFNWRAGFIETPPIQLEMKFLQKQIPLFANAVKLGPGVAGPFAFAGHNHAWRAGYGWQPLVRDPDTLRPVYDSSNLNNLFKGVVKTNLADEGWLGP